MVIRWSTAVRNGARASPQTRLDLLDGGFEGVDLGEVQLQQEAMMSHHAAVQGGHELGAGGFEAAAGEVGQAVGIGLAGDQGLEDGATTHAEEVAEQAGQLEVGVLQRLPDPQGVLRDLPHELLAGAGEIAQLLDGGGRDEAAADEPVGETIGDPGRIGHITLPPRDVAERLGVGEDQLECAFEDVPDRSPVHSGRFHRDMGTAVSGKPVAGGEEFRRRRAEGSHVVRDDLARHAAGAGDHGVLMHIETTTGGYISFITTSWLGSRRRGARVSEV
jgi:hypothetical protein